MALHAAHVLEGLARCDARPCGRQAIADRVQRPSGVNDNASQDPPSLIPGCSHDHELHDLALNCYNEQDRFEKAAQHVWRLA